MLNANRSPMHENAKTTGLKNILPEIIENHHTETEQSPYKKSDDTIPRGVTRDSSDQKDESPSNDIRVNSRSRRDDPRRISLGGGDRNVIRETLGRYGFEAGEKAEGKSKIKEDGVDPSGVTIEEHFSGLPKIGVGVEEEGSLFGNDNGINRLMK